MRNIILQLGKKFGITEEKYWSVWREKRKKQTIFRSNFTNLEIYK